MLIKEEIIIKIQKLIKSISNNKYTEFSFFAVFVLVNSIFIFKYNYIVSLDGPQHIYNSNIIIELLKSNPTTLQFFKINPILVGYWTAHALLSFFNSIFPAFIAEKLFLLTLSVGVPFAFRYFVKSFHKSNNYIIILILPFAIHQFFLHGYYAFCLGWLFFFVTLGYFFRNFDTLKTKSAIFLSILLFGAYLTHLIVYAFTLFFIFTFLFIDALSINKKEFKLQLSSKIKKVSIILITALPSLFFGYLYYNHVKSIDLVIPQRQFTSEMLWDGLVKLDCLVAFNHNLERPYNQMLFYSIAGLFIFSVIYFMSIIIKHKRLTNEIKLLISILLSITILFVFYFNASDVIGTGAIKFRVLTYITFLIIMFISILRHKWYLQLFTAAFIFYYTINIMNVREDGYRYLSEQASEFKEVELRMRDNTTFVAFNFLKSWNNGHLPLYVGSDKNLISLQNPQCFGHFPVIWNWDSMPAMYLGEYNSSYFNYNWHTNTHENHKIQIIDYVVVFGNWEFLNNEANKTTKKRILEYYEPIFVSSRGYVGLYEFRYKNVLDSTFNANLSNNNRNDFYKVKEIEYGMNTNNSIYMDAIKSIKKNNEDFIDYEYYLTAIYNTPNWLQMVEEKAKSQNRSVQEVASEEANYMLSRYEKEIRINQKESISLDTYIIAILNNDAWSEHVRQKADSIGISFYEMVLIDANYKYESYLKTKN